MSHTIKNRIWIAVFIMCCIGIIAGGVNIGFSRFFTAIPFMLGASFISSYILRSKKLIILATALTALSICCSLSITYNPLIFPILRGGEVKILRDGYQVTFIDGSGSFRLEKMCHLELVNRGILLSKRVRFMP